MALVPFLNKKICQFKQNPTIFVGYLIMANTNTIFYHISFSTIMHSGSRCMP